MTWKFCYHCSWVDSSRIILQTRATPGNRDKDAEKLTVRVYNRNGEGNRWKTASDILTVGAGKVFLAGDEPDRIFVLDLEGKTLKTLEIPGIINAYPARVAYDDEKLFLRIKKKHEIYSLAAIDVNSGNTRWTYNLGEEPHESYFIFHANKLYLFHELRFCGHLSILDPESGVVKRTIGLGPINAKRINVNAGKLYVTHTAEHRPMRMNSSVLVLDQDLDGEENFKVDPLARIFLNIGKLKLARSYDPVFYEKLFSKYEPGAEGVSRKRALKASEKFKTAIRQDPTNPYSLALYILTKLEAGRSRDSLQDEINNLLNKCSHDVFCLTSIGSLFSRLRYDKLAKIFLERAVEISPVLSADFGPSSSWMLSSPGFFLYRAARQLKDQQGEQTDRIARNISYLERISPGNEFLYPFWSALSQMMKREGKPEESKKAAQKAIEYFYHTKNFPHWRHTFFDFLTIFSIVMGFLFLATSIWFSLRANYARRYAEIQSSGVKSFKSTIDLLKQYLKPAEKNVLGFLLSLGLLSVFVDVVILFLVRISDRSIKIYYDVILAVSIITGAVVFIYLLIAGLRVERRYYSKYLPLRKGKFIENLNNSFLAYMGKKEKYVLICLSLLGIILALIMNSLISNLLFLVRTPLNYVGSYYVSDWKVKKIQDELKKNPGNSYAHLLMGRAYLENGKYKNSIEHLKTYMEKHPGDYGAMGNIAIARFHQDPEAGLKLMEQTLKKAKHKGNFKDMDRIYYNLEIMLEKEGRSSLSLDARKDLREIDSQLIFAYRRLKPGNFLPFNPSLDQEMKAIGDYDYFKTSFHSYLYPVTAIGHVEAIFDSEKYNLVSLFIWIPLYSAWTLILILSLFLLKEPSSKPVFCKRCGGNLVDPRRNDPRSWCDRCKENDSYQLPSLFQLIFPGVYQLKTGKIIRGILYSAAWLYGLVYLFILYFPFKHNLPIQCGDNSFIGPLSSTVTITTFFPYKAAEDPALSPYIFAILGAFVLVLILNAVEVLLGGRFHGERGDAIRKRIKTGGGVILPENMSIGSRSQIESREGFVETSSPANLRTGQRSIIIFPRDDCYYH